MTTNIDLANRALAMAGTRSQLTAFNDGTPEGLYCGLLYNEFRDFLLRQGDYGFSIINILTVPFSGTPRVGYNFIYQYPNDCVRIRQMLPGTGDVFDPQPVNWALDWAGTTSAIVTDVSCQEIVYTANSVNETFWDAMFTDSFVRMLASGLHFALENRIEAHRVALQEALEFAQIANLRDS